MKRLTFTRLVNPRIRIIARTSEVSHMPEQVPLRILHPQVAEVRANYEKRYRRLPLGPALDWQSLDQNKPTPVEHFIEGLLQLEPRHRQLNISGADSRKVLPRFFYLLYRALY